jgi:hypothetical protein
MGTFHRITEVSYIQEVSPRDREKTVELVQIYRMACTAPEPVHRTPLLPRLCCECGKVQAIVHGWYPRRTDTPYSTPHGTGVNHFLSCIPHPPEVGQRKA